MNKPDAPPFDPKTPLGYLETVERVSGQPREVEIWFGYEAGMIYLLSGGGLKKDWTRNILKTPAVRFRVDGAWVRGVARVADEPILEARIRRVVGGKYYHFDPDGDAPLPNDWSRTASPVAIEIA